MTSFKLRRILFEVLNWVACQFDQTHISLTLLHSIFNPALNDQYKYIFMPHYWYMLHIVNTPKDAHEVNFNYRWWRVFFHFCMDVMRIWSLIRKPLIKLQSTVLSHTEGWQLELCRNQTCSSTIVNVPHVMLYIVAVMLLQIRAPGHLSACGTIVTPVNTFAVTFLPFLCWMTW